MGAVRHTILIVGLHPASPKRRETRRDRATAAAAGPIHAHAPAYLLHPHPMRHTRPYRPTREIGTTSLSYNPFAVRASGIATRPSRSLSPSLAPLRNCARRQKTHIRNIIDIRQPDRVVVAHRRGEQGAVDELRAIEVLLDGDAVLGVSESNAYGWDQGRVKRMGRGIANSESP
jgi:hypothetical protein